jgi:SAM-dependent methyltransferase
MGHKLWFMDRYCLAALTVIGVSIGLLATVTPQAPPRAPDVRYEPTPLAVVRAMLQLAHVGANDVVYDLGCGDGRIVIAAAKRGARGVGVDIDPQRIVEAHATARHAEVVDRVHFVQQDFFDADLREATVVMLYLSPAVNLRLRPKLQRELQPGTRLVSHSHDMGATGNPRRRRT